MKRSRFTVIAFILIGILLLAGCGAKQQVAAATTPEVIETLADAKKLEEQQTSLANPVHDVDSYSALLESVPGVLMSDAPAGATGISYSYIDGTPVIAQICFTLAGDEYTYRAAALGPNDTTDISGVYDTLDKSASMSAPDVDDFTGGDFTLRYATGSNLGLATWYYEGTECQYSVYTPTGCDVGQGIVSVVRQVLPLTSVAIDASTPSGKLEGVTVVSAQDGEMVVNTSDGQTLQLSLVMFTELPIAAGDVADISYFGDLNDWPVALSVEKSKAAATAAANSISGTVYSFTNNSIYVSTDSGMVYGFSINESTKFSGKATALSNGNSVVVTYEGTDFATNVTATAIETTEVTAKKQSSSSSSKNSSDSLENKRLSGYVTGYNSYAISMMSGAGHEFTFRINSFTSIYGHYHLGVGSKVRVVYDGYASDSPAAKKIEVYSDAGDNPESNRHTMNGYLVNYGGSYLTINTDSGNQHSFTITSSTRFVGGGQSGSPVKVTYTGTEEGNKTATKVVFY